MGQPGGLAGEATSRPTSASPGSRGSPRRTSAAAAPTASGGGRRRCRRWQWRRRHDRAQAELRLAERERLPSRLAAAEALSRQEDADRHHDPLPRRRGLQDDALVQAPPPRPPSRQALPEGHEGSPAQAEVHAARDGRAEAHVHDEEGAPPVRFQGRFTRRSKLAPGRYELTLIAVDAAKNASRAVRKRFTLKPAYPVGQRRC